MNAAAVLRSGLILATTGVVGYAWGAHLFTWGCLRRARDVGARVALTFDDGPDAVATPRVLGILAEYGVRGTFFLVGRRAAAAPATVRTIVDSGHEVANHSWSHRSLWLCGPKRTFEEIGRAHELLRQLTGRPPMLFRPPWGMVNAAMFPALARHGERCVFWSIQPEGLRPAAAPAQVTHVLRRAHPGAIVDLHDAAGTQGAPARLCEALPRIIEGLAAAGYAFATVGELTAAGAG